MSQNLYTAPVGLLMAFLILLVGCSASVENRATSPVVTSQRKPPFNGSIFGKRSILPATLGVEGYNAGVGVGGNSQPITGYNYGPDSPVEALAYFIQQQEALIRASINQCVAQYRAPGTDPITHALCAELIGGNQQVDRRSLEAGDWFSQLVSP